VGRNKGETEAEVERTTGRSGGRAFAMGSRCFGFGLPHVRMAVLMLIGCVLLFLLKG